MVGILSTLMVLVLMVLVTDGLNLRAISTDALSENALSMKKLTKKIGDHLCLTLGIQFSVVFLKKFLRKRVILLYRVGP